MDDLIGWIQDVFEDCSFRAPFGIGWHLDRAEPPITVIVTPADRSTGRIVITRDDLLERINFVARLQAFLDLELDRPVPPCPAHAVALGPVRDGDVVHWRCPADDFRCQIGDYQEALWPPDPDEDRHRVAPMLARRFSRRRLSGIHSFSVEWHDGRATAKIKLSPDADEPAIRAAAQPIELQVERVEPARTIRVQRAATTTEPAHRALTVTGIAVPLASLRGRLSRARATDSYDFLVDDTPVRLVPDHQLGPPPGPVVLDTDGVPFADEGDTVCCVGGFVKTGPVLDEPPIFSAGELRVYNAALVALSSG